MPGPNGTPVLDDFNRVNSTGISNASWTTDFDGAGRSSFNITSNQATAAAGGFSSNYWSAATFGPDCEVFATLVVLPSVQAARLQLGLTGGVGTSSVDGYALTIDHTSPTVVLIERIDNGVLTTPAGGILTVTPVAGDIFALSRIGTTITAYRNGASIGSIVDATYTAAGNLGIVAQNDTAVIWEDFGGGAIVAGFTNTVVPFLTTTSPALGGTIHVDSGTWTPTPGSYRYYWERADDAAGTNLTSVGSTGATYTLAAADVGKVIHAGVVPQV